MSRVSTGMLNDDIPYLAIGNGPPLVMAMGLTPTHELPTGMERRGESMSEIAGYLITAIEQEFGQPVLLTGTSTGGSVVLQLAVDRADLVRAQVVVASAYRLDPRGRELQRELARRTGAGDGAGGLAQLMTAMLPKALRRPALPLVHRMVGSMAPEDPTDLLVTLDAEDAFDVGEQLHRISAPTLVIGGARDPFYPRTVRANRRRSPGRQGAHPSRLGTCAHERVDGDRGAIRWRRAGRALRPPTDRPCRPRRARRSFVPG